MQQHSELELSLPKCLAEYLVLLFYELGICESGFNGASPLTWKEIQAWQQATQRRLTPWEVTTLKDMSKAYVSECNNTEKNRPMPYKEEVEVDKVKQEEQLGDFFEMLMMQNKQDTE